MARIEFTFTIAVFAIVLAISFQEAFALDCWHCDNQRYPSCGYPFEGKALNKSLLVDCKGADPVCLKVVSLDEKYITRKCVPSKAHIDILCVIGGIRGSFCENCNSDECNNAAQYGPAAIFVAVPVAIMKIFSLF